MIDRKGLTLIEVILSLAILGIISVAFLTSISSHFTFINKTKSISKAAFEAQGKMEKEIEKVKKDIRDGTLTTGELKEKTIFSELGSIKVKYYPVKKTFNNKNYYTFVSNIKPIIFKPLELKSIGINLKQGVEEVPNGYSVVDFKVIGDFENKVKDENGKNIKYDHLLNIVEWYATTKPYNIPYPKDPNFIIEEVDKAYYPNFPDDYVLVSNLVINNIGVNKDIILPEIKLYAGKHMVFTATPGAKSGKIGIQSKSKPVFISGLPVVEGLTLHLDASFIDPSQNEEIEKSGGLTKVNKWVDISSVYGKTKPDESATLVFSSEKPILMKTEVGMEYIGQYVKFEENQYLQINNQKTSEKTINLFAVVRNRAEIGEPLFLRNGNKDLKILNEFETINGKWVIVKDEFSSDSDSFIIGGANVDIAEMAIYNNGLTTDNLNLIEVYFREKYK